VTNGRRADRSATGSGRSRGEQQQLIRGFAHAGTATSSGIYCGRQAYVVGSGLAVWEVLMVAEGPGWNGATVCIYVLTETMSSR
jgi:hypothetical protein